MWQAQCAYLEYMGSQNFSCQNVLPSTERLAWGCFRFHLRPEDVLLWTVQKAHHYSGGHQVVLLEVKVIKNGKVRSWESLRRFKKLLLNDKKDLWHFYYLEYMTLNNLNFRALYISISIGKNSQYDFLQYNLFCLSRILSKRKNFYIYLSTALSSTAAEVENRYAKKYKENLSTKKDMTTS